MHRIQLCAGRRNQHMITSFKTRHAHSTTHHNNQPHTHADQHSSTPLNTPTHTRGQKNSLYRKKKTIFCLELFTPRSAVNCSRSGVLRLDWSVRREDIVDYRVTNSRKLLSQLFQEVPECVFPAVRDVQEPIFILVVLVYCSHHRSCITSSSSSWMALN